MRKEKLYRKPWFLGLKKIMRLFIKKSDFIYLGEKLSERGIVLSNHVGTSAPDECPVCAHARAYFEIEKKNY